MRVSAPHQVDTQARGGKESKHQGCGVRGGGGGVIWTDMCCLISLIAAHLAAPHEKRNETTELQRHPFVMAMLTSAQASPWYVHESSAGA